jgi:hypothetical protein
MIAGKHSEIRNRAQGSMGDFLATPVFGDEEQRATALRKGTCRDLVEEESLRERQAGSCLQGGIWPFLRKRDQCRLATLSLAERAYDW